ncbi:B12-binding domain-containing radical SAM protein [Prolixibacter bellariivorans]|uniref:B12-binding domain-containing radical SAM protein n=1 Tax=Prolixibacter bellariivorans TaxID=314319 RepID=A0A5M4B355_9BACT|nr:B12-binding domain-containing radical SAM protein [Prolixibacter bellariivorans]GET34524.1 B12-binding domain-containing radical SAM protein [Prolixibacter bellariivorans]
MNILLVYPVCPDSFWSFKNALKFIAKKAAVPPLGLITVSAMLPSSWKKKLVDMNIQPLHSRDIQWADYVFISAMYIQKESVDKVIAECQKWHKKIVAGGPLFTQEYNDYPQIDHFVLNEAEITLPSFLKDLQENQPKRLYQTSEYADITETPVPDFHLLSVKAYAFMNIQVSRGCPFACNFCEITSLLGHKVRMKKTSQIINELDVLYHKIKWRGPVSIVDDNFIGNIREIKNNLLPAMKEWMQEHKYPFTFNIESSINLADDEALMALLAETGINSTFIGIETPVEESLHYCNKAQNRNRNLLESVRKIQKGGLQVSGGFIVGFDSDTPTVFQRQIDFIQQSGIVSAMVGLLNAPKNTRLYNQLKAENRLTNDATGNNTDTSMNFIPKMDYDELQKGYQNIIHSIYSIKPYYRRLRRLLLNYNRKSSRQSKVSFSLLMAFLKSIYIIGLVNKGRSEYWKLVFWTLYKRPRAIVDAVTYTVYGYHFRKVYGLQQ